MAAEAVDQTPLDRVVESAFKLAVVAGALVGGLALVGAKILPFGGDFMEGDLPFDSV